MIEGTILKGQAEDDKPAHKREERQVTGILEA